MPAQSALDEALHTAEDPRGWKYIVLHHSAAEHGDVASIDADHRTRVDSNGESWMGIGYHFVVGNGSGMPDGHVASTFRWTGQLHGAHSGDREHNDWGIGICLIGNFEETKPSMAQVEATAHLIAELRRRYGIAEDRILLHRDIKATACPGKHFDLQAVLAAAQELTKSTNAIQGK